MTSVARWRGIVHAAVFLAIGAAAFVGVPFAGCAYLGIGTLRLVCPVGFVETALASHSVPWGLVPGFLVMCVLLVLLGRAYCAWACPASFLGMQVRRLAVRLLPGGISRGVGRWWRALGERVSARVGADRGDGVALLLGLAAGVAFFGWPAFSVVCPVGVVSRGLIEAVTHHVLRADLVLLVGPILLALLFRKGWKCACPVGTLRGLLAAPNRTLVPVVRADACRGCMRCARVCPAGLDPEAGAVDPMLCSKCMRCMDACPTDAVRLALVAPSALARSERHAG
ncbi:ferredoxin-type protein NapH [Desulfobaculum xiamenense]|uniref:Ferredoxin-type protein NapH n=1 Tax=Desulfobaculum xiamenense TaxID=995050 RepID=A0A846QPR7_9BACT|nr:4Fe-4S binding protein [Desulfobaculum xiamenense]NJB68313.1 ferredoxin-type protein NapH [Desulfobaculum xiamenense]